MLDIQTGNLPVMIREGGESILYEIVPVHTVPYLLKSMGKNIHINATYCTKAYIGKDKVY